MKKITTRPNGTKLIETINTQPSMTDQSQADQCDVNNIMEQYIKTGTITHLSKTIGQFADLSEIGDLQDSIHKLQTAQEAFDALPAATRFKFSNSPIEMLNFLQDPQNDEQAIALGLKTQHSIDLEKTEPPKSSPKKPKQDIAKNDDKSNDDE